MYLSDELYKAIELGYKIKIIRGYLFDKMDIYSEFINYFYKIKQENTYNSPSYIISKLIMNSLYGRLGMNPEKEIHIILDVDKTTNIYKNYVVTDVEKLNNNKELLSYIDNSNEELDIY
jgi:hypothetical protein